MSLDSGDVAGVARLARLRIGEEERESLAGELGRILELVAEMDRADTGAIEPMAHPLDQRQRLREDRVTEPDRRDALQAGAPAVRDGFYLVPRFLD